MKISPICCFIAAASLACGHNLGWKFGQSPFPVSKAVKELPPVVIACKVSICVSQPYILAHISQFLPCGHCIECPTAMHYNEKVAVAHALSLASMNCIIQVQYCTACKQVIGTIVISKGWASPSAGQWIHRINFEPATIRLKVSLQ